jgi:hypothetical protein
MSNQAVEQLISDPSALAGLPELRASVTQGIWKQQRGQILACQGSEKTMTLQTNGTGSLRNHVARTR